MLPQGIRAFNPTGLLTLANTGHRPRLKTLINNGDVCADTELLKTIPPGLQQHPTGLIGSH